MAAPNVDQKKPEPVSPRVQSASVGVLLVVFTLGLSSVMLAGAVVAIHYLLGLW